MTPSGFLTVKEGSLEYQWIEGETDLPTIVLLHEGLGCVALWKDFPAVLNQHTNCSVVVYSRLGYGDSDSCPLPRPVSYMHDEAKILEQVLAHIQSDKIILFGHSDGASIATIYSGSTTTKHILGLVLMAPHFFVEDVTIQSIEKIKEIYQSTDLGQRMTKYHGTRADDVFRGWNDIWLQPEFLQWNIIEYLKNIEVPILVLQGDDDEYGSPAQVNAVSEYADAIVQEKYYTQCGHTPHSKYRDEVSADVARFIEKLG